MALAFFAVPTRVHERYLFPLFALAAIPLAFSWRWRIVYVVAVGGDVPQHVRRPDDDLPGQPEHPGLAGDRRGDPVPVRRDGDRAGQHRGVPVGLRPAPAGGPADARGGAGARARARRLGRGGRRGPGGDRCAGRRRGRRATVAAAGAARHDGGARRVDAQAAPRAGVVRPPVMVGRRPDRLVPGADRRDTHPPRPVGDPLARGPRPPRPPRPVAADRAGRRRDGPAHVPARRAGADALRRGLPRADGRRVPPGLALRHLALHLRVDAPAPRQVRDGRRHRPVRGPRHAGDQRPRRAGPRRGHRAPPAGPVIHDRPRRRPRLGRDRLGADRLRPAHAQAGRVVDRGRRGRRGLRQRPQQAVRGHRWRGAAGPRPGQPRRPGRGRHRPDPPARARRHPRWPDQPPGAVRRRLAPRRDPPRRHRRDRRPRHGHRDGPGGRARCRRHGRRGQRPGDRRGAGPGRRPRGRRRRARLDPRRRRGLVRGPAGRHRAGDRRRRARAHGRRPREAPDGHRRREAARDLGGRRGPAGGRRHGRGHAAHR